VAASKEQARKRDGGTVIKAMDQIAILLAKAPHAVCKVERTETAFARATRERIERFYYRYAFHDCPSGSSCLCCTREESHFMSALYEVTRQGVSAIKRAAILCVMNEHYDAHALFLSFFAAGNKHPQY
jgi:hypothetical protein